MPRSTKFTKQSYGLVAVIMRSVKPTTLTHPAAVVVVAQWERTCLAFLNHFRQDNPKFDSARFLASCKGEKYRGES